VLRAEEEGSDSDSEDEKEPLENSKDQKTKNDKTKGKPQLPRGLDRLRPYTGCVLPVERLTPVAYTHKGESGGLANWAAKGQVKKTARNERRGAKALAKDKKKSVDKLVGASLWVSPGVVSLMPVRHRVIVPVAFRIEE
jgi:hypothetical protein